VGKLQHTNDKLINIFLEVSCNTLQGCLGTLFALRAELMLVATPEKFMKLRSETCIKLVIVYYKEV